MIWAGVRAWSSAAAWCPAPVDHGPASGGLIDSDGDSEVTVPSCSEAGGGGYAGGSCGWVGSCEETDGGSEDER